MSKENNGTFNSLNANNAESVEKTYELYTSEKVIIKKDEPSFNDAFNESIPKAKDSVINTEVSGKSLNFELKNSITKLKSDIEQSKVDKLRNFTENGKISPIVNEHSILQTKEQEKVFVEKMKNVKADTEIEDVNNIVVASLINKINK